MIFHCCCIDRRLELAKPNSWAARQVHLCNRNLRPLQMLGNMYIQLKVTKFMNCISFDFVPAGLWYNGRVPFWCSISCNHIVFVHVAKVLRVWHRLINFEFRVPRTKSLSMFSHWFPNNLMFIMASNQQQSLFGIGAGGVYNGGGPPNLSGPQVGGPFQTKFRTDATSDAATFTGRVRGRWI